MFTAEELEEMRRADEEIEEDFQLSEEEYQASKALDRETTDARRGGTEKVDKIRAAHRERYRQTRELSLARERRYYLENKQKIKEYKRRYYQENKARISAQQKEYRRKNAAEISEKAKARYRAKKERENDSTQV